MLPGRLYHIDEQRVDAGICIVLEVERFIYITNAMAHEL